MQIIYDYLSSQMLYPLCLRCGSLQGRTSLFCQNCEIHFLAARMGRHQRWINDSDERYIVDFLFHWIPEESDSLSELVYLLKSRLSRPTWKFFVKKFIELDQNQMSGNKTAAIPIPGSRPDRIAYHTRYFSEEWVRQTGASLVPCLKSANTKASQKELSLEERANSTMEFLEEFTNILKDCERVVLIDDIVTSGHTIRASLTALKPYLRPGCLIEIKALLSREKI